MKIMSFTKDMAPAVVTLTQIQMEIMIQMRNQKLYRKKESEGEEIPEPATEELQNQSQNHTHLLLKEELQVSSFFLLKKGFSQNLFFQELH